MCNELETASILALSESYWTSVVKWFTMTVEMLCNKLKYSNPQ